MASCWKKKFIRAKRIVRVTIMVLICALLALLFWGPYSMEQTIRWLPLNVISKLSKLTKSITQISAFHVVHLGIIGYGFHRLPKKNTYARISVKKKKIAAISVSAFFILLECVASFLMAGYLFSNKAWVNSEVRAKMLSELPSLQPLSTNLPGEIGSGNALMRMNPNNTLLNFAITQYSCCGVETEQKCTYTHRPVEICMAGASKCSPGCLQYVMQRSIFPAMDTAASVGFIVGSFAFIELILELRKIGKTIIQEGRG